MVGELKQVGELRCVIREALKKEEIERRNRSEEVPDRNYRKMIPVFLDFTMEAEDGTILF